MKKLVLAVLAVAALYLVFMRVAVDTPIEEVPSLAGQVDDARIQNADSEPGNWLAYGRDYQEQRFSPLTQINRETVSRLDLAWFADMHTTRTLEATPLVVDGVMFVSSAWSKVHAFDAVSGQELWMFDPEVPGAWARKACCDVVSRGVAVYRGRVYLATLDGRLIALNAGTGNPEWEVDTLVDRSRDYTITGAPRVARGKVFIGNGGAEYGVRGYVTAYDADTGAEVWRFYTVPGDPSLPFEHPEMEMAAKTWKGGEWWKLGGGGTVWNSIVYDPEFNHLYLGVGNGAPWPRAIRSPGGGDNLFLSSIVAVNADTGVLQWYYQTTPGDNWDYTAVQDMVLADLEVDGVQRKVLMQAPKNGFFYVLDRSDGELLRAHPYTVVNWATHVDMETGRPVESAIADYLEKPRWIVPGAMGGHNWQAMSFDAQRGIMYIPTQEAPGIYGMPADWQASGQPPPVAGTWNLGLDLGGAIDAMDEAGDAPPARGALKAFDPLTGETRWEAETSHYWNGGILATAGDLVFQGNNEGRVRAFDADTGESLWAFDAHTGFLAPPVSYQVDGVQYLAILAGTGGGDMFAGEVEGLASTSYRNTGRLLVFSLGGTAQLPEPALKNRDFPELETAQFSASDLKRGERLYHSHCAMCHGLTAKSGGTIPDLRFMPETQRDNFEAIVLGGLLEEGGMDSFADVVSAAGVAQIKAYVSHRAVIDRAEAERIELE